MPPKVMTVSQERQSSSTATLHAHKTQRQCNVKINCQELQGVKLFEFPDGLMNTKHCAPPAVDKATP